MRLAYLLFLLAAFMAACGSDTNSGNTSTPTAPNNERPEASVSISNADVLVWVGEGRSPSEQAAPGQIALMDEDGELEPFFELPQGVNRVHACGESATSPNGRYFTFYAGAGEMGTLYQIKNDDLPEPIGSNVHALACVGMGGFQYRADSERLGYIAFPSNSITGTNVPRGTLHIVDSDDRDEIVQFENVVAFDFYEDDVAYVTLFSSTNSEIREAGVFQWNRGNPTEVSTLFADDGCVFRSASVRYFDEKSLSVQVGQSCTGRASRRTLYTVDIEARSATAALTEETRGSFYVESRTNNVLVAPTDAAIYPTFPDGNDRNQVNIQRLLPGNITASEPLMGSGVMPRFVLSTFYNPSENAAPVLSRDGRWFAVASNDPNDNASLNIFDLNATELPPISLSAGARFDTISAMAFTADSKRLLFISGGHSNNNNSLFMVDLESGTDTRVIRGRFAPWFVVSPDGKYVAAAEYRISSSVSQPNSLAVVVIDLSKGEAETIFNGVRTEANPQRFVYPLSWR